VWLVFGSWFYLYSQGIAPTILGRMSQEIVFPFWVFLLIAIPVCIVSMLICYIVMVAREFEQTLSKENKLDFLFEDKR
jgi:hypothetical protein